MTRPDVYRQAVRSLRPTPEPEPLRETFKEVAAGFVVLVLWAAAFWLWASIGVAVRL